MNRIKLILAVFIAVFVLAVSEQPGMAYEYCEDHPTYQKYDEDVTRAIEKLADAIEEVERAEKKERRRYYELAAAVSAATTGCVAAPTSCWAGAMAGTAVYLRYEDAVDDLNDAIRDMNRAGDSYERAKKRWNNWIKSNCR